MCVSSIFDGGIAPWAKRKLPAKTDLGRSRIELLADRKE